MGVSDQTPLAPASSPPPPYTADVVPPIVAAIGSDAAGPSVPSFPASPADAVPYPRGEWSTGLWECFSSDDCAISACGCFCPCLLFANTRGMMHPEGRARSLVQLRACLLYVAVSCIEQRLTTKGIPLPVLPLYTSRTRGAIRRIFGIQGDGKCFTDLMAKALCMQPRQDPPPEECQQVCDFFVHWFCLPCALCQEAREVRRRQQAPYQPIGVLVPVLAPPAQQQPFARA